MFVDLSASTNRFSALLITFALLLNFDKKLFLTGPNSTLWAIVNKSDSNLDKSSTDGLQSTKHTRWKALEFLGKLDLGKKEALGFKSNKYSPYLDILLGFESDLLMMIHFVEFKPVEIPKICWLMQKNLPRSVK